MGTGSSEAAVAAKQRSIILRSPFPEAPSSLFTASPPPPAPLTLSSACHTVREERRSSREHSRGWLRMLGRSLATASREALGRE